MKVTNVTEGPKGIHNAEGALVMLNPGQTEDIDLAKGEDEGEWFKFGHPPKAAVKEEPKPEV